MEGNPTEPNTLYKVRVIASLIIDTSSINWRPSTGGLWPSALLIKYLIGVMRFLQTEWHRHERDRNAWQIERAEMKSRIGKLEGDGRTSKRLQESLGKHVKILENALKREREKLKSLSNEAQGEEKRAESGESAQEAKATSKRELTKN